MKRLTLITFLLTALLTACAGTTNSAKREVDQARLAKAEAIFQERCKTSGEFIHRTAENVDGVLLMKIRPEQINYGDQYRMDDPYGNDMGGNAYIEMFLRGDYEANHSGTPIAGAPLPPKGYIYVDAHDPSDGKRYRYTGSMKVVGRKNPDTPNHRIELQRNPNFDLNNYAFVLDKNLVPNPPPRYGVTYDDISTREERDYWIAGSSLKVIDLQTNEVMAERIGYMMDRGQGANGGGRSPWLLAANYACPSFQRNPLRPPGHGSSSQIRQAQYFVEKILKPVLEK